jgi:hypothetical protein
VSIFPACCAGTRNSSRSVAEKAALKLDKVYDRIVLPQGASHARRRRLRHSEQDGGATPGRCERPALFPDIVVTTSSDWARLVPLKDDANGSLRNAAGCDSVGGSLLLG